jgi:hypothetical protein
MNRAVIRALRVVLVLLALGAVAAQVLIVVVPVTQFSRPPDALNWSYMSVGVVALLCVEAGLLALWVLLSRVARGSIFDHEADRWVWVITAAGFLAALLAAGLCVHAGELSDAPGMVLVGFAFATAGVGFALLMTVMLGLLRTATGLRTELEQVV